MPSLLQIAKTSELVNGMEKGLSMLDIIEDPTALGILSSRISPELLALKKEVDYKGEFNVSESVAKKFQGLTGQEWRSHTGRKGNLALRNKISGRVAWQRKGTWQVRSKWLCHWIITDWGQTQKADELSDKTIKLLNRRIATWKKESDAPKAAMGFDRVASWSKVLALAFPDECVILDSRTIYTLNWLVFISNLTLDPGSRFKYWPVPPGRNAVRGLLSFQCLSSVLSISEVDWEDYEASIKDLPATYRRRSELPKRYAYHAYIRLLASLADEVFPKENRGLLKTEMLLYAAAKSAIPSRVASFISERF